MALSRIASPAFFATAADFRVWLERHGANERELIVGFYKIGSGRPGMTWPESVDEALCVGWIDGVRTRIDDAAYKIRFTPRKATSIWSAVNVAKVAKLIAEDRMRPAGLQAWARRVEHKTSVYAFEQAGTLQLATRDERLFRRHKAAWVWFETCAPSYRKTMTHWVLSAKREDTRQRRLAQLIEASAARLKLRG